MPFTPYHLGPNGLIGSVFFRWINLPAILLVNAVVDMESLIVIVFNIRKYPEHGFFHSFAGAAVAALLFSLVYSAIKKPVNELMGAIGLRQNPTMLSIVLGCVLGAWMHVFLDSCLYKDIMPFFPLDNNPMYGLVTPAAMRLLCIAAGGLAAVVFVVRGMFKKVRG
jgi:hypothetical protein